jgi:hypothetical protein
MAKALTYEKQRYDTMRRPLTSELAVSLSDLLRRLRAKPEKIIVDVYAAMLNS